MVSDYCKLDLTKGKFKNLSKADKEAVEKSVDEMIERAAKKRDIDSNQAIMMELDEYERLLDIAKKHQQVNAYRNILVQAQMMEIMDGSFANDPSEGIMAFLLGSQNEKFGARNHAASRIEMYKHKYVNNLRKLLVKDKLMGIFSSGKFDDDIRRAALYLDQGVPVDGLNKDAVLIAKHLQTVNKMLRKDANSTGAMVGELQGYVTTQGHNQWKIKANKDAWTRFMKERIDFSRSTFSTDRLDEELLQQWSEFSSGAHIADQVKFDTPGKGLSGFQSIAKSLSKNRKIHFKTVEDEIEYAKLFGNASLADDVFGNLTNTGRRVGMQTALGPNFRMNIDNAINKKIDNLNKAGKADLADKLNKTKGYLNSNGIPQLTGENNIAGNQIAATVDSSLSMLNRTAKLGAVALASTVGDPITHGLNMAMFDRNVASFFTGYGSFFKGLGRNLASEEVQDFMSELYLTTTHMLNQINPRFSDSIIASNKIEMGSEKLQNFFFKWTGQTYLDDHFRVGASIGVAHKLGKDAKLPYDKLSDGHKRIMSWYGITPDEWEFARTSTKTLEGFPILDVENIINSNGLSDYVVAKGFKDTPFQRERIARDLADKFRNVINDQQSYSVLGADDRLRAWMYAGSKRGTVGNVTARQLATFKGWPLAYMQRVLRRTLSSNDTHSTKALNMFGVMVAMMAGGYTLVQLGELRNGREPKPMSWELIKESMIRGGGLGFYGDILYAAGEENTGEKALTKLAGPTAENVVKAFNIYNDAYSLEPSKSTDTALNLIKSNTPFANHFLVKPVMDYIFLNQVAEYVSPGVLSRAEQKRSEKYGNNYLPNVPPPSERMLFK
jgi:hypothetical protein